MTQLANCLFECKECKRKWRQKLIDYADTQPMFSHQGKRVCPHCGSKYYTWRNFKD